MSLIENLAIPFENSLRPVVKTLSKYSMRERFDVFANDNLIPPADAPWAYCATTGLANSTRGFIFDPGCIQAPQSNKNIYPTSIAAFDKYQQQNLNPKSKAAKVTLYAMSLYRKTGIIAHSCGAAEPENSVLNPPAAYFSGPIYPSFYPYKYSLRPAHYTPGTLPVTANTSGKTSILKHADITTKQSELLQEKGHV